MASVARDDQKDVPVLVTGAAGFIGFHTTQALLKKGRRVVGYDNVNDYYTPALKEMRLAQIRAMPQGSAFEFVKGGLEDKDEVMLLFKKHRFKTVINLAAQAGVRYSLTNPDVYVQANLAGFLNILEGCRHHGSTNLIFASSSSVYGLNRKMPFSEEQSLGHPISLYAASKKANELMAHTYAHLFGLPCTGLRFFTVYGPWGRPDMAMFIFANAILDEKPIKLFRGGDMDRDFTYVADIVESIIRLTEKPATPNPAWNPEAPEPCSSSAPYRIYNIGNHSPVRVKDLIGKMEKLLGKKAIIQVEPMQPGDVPATYAAVDRLHEAVDFAPRTSVDEGLKLFLDWLLWYRKVSSKAKGSP